MASSNNSKTISVAHPHTIKKFELIEEYITTWADILLLSPKCNGIIFIDCMCNSGVYTDDNGDEVHGTPIRVSKVLLEAARRYPSKQVHIYLNDNSEEKIDFLSKHLPPNERNFQIITTTMDGNDLLMQIGPQLYGPNHMHYFLLYDPYDASINWDALLPFFRNWGEVMINHMVSDPVRAIRSAKKRTTKEKYENTYLEEFEKLVPYGSDMKAYEARVEEIINTLKGNRRYFVAAFPFFNTQNAQLYYLIHCTSSLRGFKLYKTSAWKVFDAQSSGKRSSEDRQLTFDLFEDASELDTKSCMHIFDIAKYLQRTFKGRQNVPLDEIWKTLEYHPVFPSDGFRRDIKKELTESFGAKIDKITNAITGKRETVISFSL